MKVFKFGGGSVQNAESVKQLEEILRLHSQEQLVVVISAIGKTTNLMEKILDAWYAHSSSLGMFLEELKNNHFEIVQQLNSNTEKIMQNLQPLLDNLAKILREEPSGHYDYDYDRVVGFGELISTTLISSYLTLNDLPNLWSDARQLIKTDGSHREGRVNWGETVPLIRNYVTAFLGQNNKNIIITQGFIGSTTQGITTTLGREGSDYTAAIFGFSLEVDNVTIWKDVPGLFNADPHLFPDAVKLDSIPYEEAIELSYYGAGIIHPKTLKPLQNKKIPLYVKFFFHPEESGSRISAEEDYTPISSFIFKKNQILISIFPKDFSFIAVNNLSEIFTTLSQERISINLMQNSALSFSICFDYNSEKVERLLEELKKSYIVKYNQNVELATIRHYNDESLQKILNHKKREIGIAIDSIQHIQVSIYHSSLYSHYFICPCFCVKIIITFHVSSEIVNHCMNKTRSSYYKQIRRS